MKRHFNIHVYKTYDEFSILFKLDESKIIEDYDDEDVINLAIDLGELNEEDLDFVDSIEEISAEEYLKSTQGFSIWQMTV
jgi:hypothetical protein